GVPGRGEEDKYGRTLAMTDNHLPPAADSDLPDVAAQNLERLLEKAYRPEAPDPEFAQRVRDRLTAAARERVPAALPRRPIFGRRTLGYLAAAAALAGLAFLLHALTAPPAPKPDAVAKDDRPNRGDPDAEQPGQPDAADAAVAPADRLTPLALDRPKTPPVAKLEVGQSRRTGAGERLRLAL